MTLENHDTSVWSGPSTDNQSVTCLIFIKVDNIPFLLGGPTKSMPMSENLVEGTGSECSKPGGLVVAALDV